jgi:hypothetical protein
VRSCVTVRLCVCDCVRVCSAYVCVRVCACVCKRDQFTIVSSVLDAVELTRLLSVLTLQVQRAVEVKTQAAVQSMAVSGASGGLYDWESLDMLQQLMYGTTDISPAALKEELGMEIASLYIAGKPQDAENR